MCFHIICVGAVLRRCFVVCFDVFFFLHVSARFPRYVFCSPSFALMLQCVWLFVVVVFVYLFCMLLCVYLVLCVLMLF